MMRTAILIKISQRQMIKRKIRVSLNQKSLKIKRKIPNSQRTPRKRVALNLGQTLVRRIKISDTSAGENTSNSDESQTGKIYIGNSNKIVGNARTHKYHVPRQAGYNMTAANAVYFDSEEEAQAAGYVRSKR